MRYVTAIALFSLGVGVLARSQKRGIGEDCLRSVDCESSNCLASICVTEPTKNTTTPPLPPAKDASQDSNPPVQDASVDAADAADASDGPAPDALLDAPRDSAVDVHVG